MSFRSEWTALLTVTGLIVLCGATPPKRAVAPLHSRDIIAQSRDDIAAAGIDYMPIGSARAVDRARAAHQQR